MEQAMSQLSQPNPVLSGKSFNCTPHKLAECLSKFQKLNPPNANSPPVSSNCQSLINSLTCSIQVMASHTNILDETEHQSDDQAIKVSMDSQRDN